MNLTETGYDCFKCELNKALQLNGPKGFILIPHLKDDPDVLNQKLISICQFLAIFYRTEILYRKIRFKSPENDTDSLMTQIG